jgi:lipoprotein NlpD
LNLETKRRMRRYQGVKLLIAVVCATALVNLAGCIATRPAPVSDRAPPPKSAPPPVAQPVLPPLKSGDNAAQMYTVKSGDTVFSIAKAHSVDPGDLATWNSLEGNRIHVGQQLRVNSPDGVATAPMKPAPDVIEARPIDSTPVIADPGMKTSPLGVRVPYSDEAYAEMAKVSPSTTKPDVTPSTNSATAADSDWLWPTNGKIVGNYGSGAHKGISIAGKMSQPVVASAGGRVIFSGTGIRGLGRLIVIKHDKNYLSVYAHNSKLLVKEGQNVNRGQKIAEMGNSDADRVKLHFEIRKQGKPVDPTKLLPQL